MPTIAEYYEYAKIAAAAYIRLEGVPYGTGSVVAVVAGSGDNNQKVLPDKLANQMFNSGSDSWRIKHPHHNDASGFAATLFECGSELVLGIRGTEPEVDGQFDLDLLKADINDIGVMGVAIDQGVSLFNYIQRLKAPASNNNVVQLKYRVDPSVPASGDYIQIDMPVDPDDPRKGTVASYVSLEASYDGKGLEMIGEGQSIKVSGHSLGGHLAALAARLFPSIVTEAYTYNAPGFDPYASAFVGIKPGQYTDEFVAFFSQYLDSAPAPSFGAISGRIHGVESEDLAPGDDGDGITGLITGKPASDEVSIATEKNSHGIGQLVDSLALQTLIAQMDSDITLNEIGALYLSSSPEDATTQEKLVQALDKLFGGTGEPLPTVEAGSNWIGDGDFSARVQYFERLLGVEERVKNAGAALRFVSLAGGIDPKNQQMYEAGPTGLAWRYALKELNPFVVIGADYSQHNQGGELTLADSAQAVPGLTEKWIEARAEMLHWRLEQNRQNDTGVIIGDNLRDNVLYTDIATETTVRVDRAIAGIPPSDAQRVQVTFGAGLSHLNVIL